MSLNEVYSSCKARELGDPTLTTRLYPPLLVRIPDDWADAKHRIAYVGQETFGWDWTSENARKHGEDWPYSDQNTLADFFQEPDSIEALTEGYRRFDFAARQPENHRSPFWRYFRDVKTAASASGEAVSMAWSNVVRCSVCNREGVTLESLTPEERRTYLDWQRGLLSAELQELNPTLVIFVSGPDYDQYLEEEFGDVAFEPVARSDPRQVARLKAAALSAPTYRTYHPRSLQMQRLGFAPLQAILDDASG